MELGPIFRSLLRGKARFFLLTLESALTLAIVVNCLTIINDARAKMTRPSGFDDGNIISVQSRGFDQALKQDAVRNALIHRDVELLAATPGVRSAAATFFLPWQGGGNSQELNVLGRPSEQIFRTQIYGVDEHVFDTLGVHVTAGRNFTHEEVERDTERLRQLFASERPPRDKREPYDQQVLVSQKLSELLFGQESALGKVLEDSDGDTYTIIGVVDRFYNPYAWAIDDYAVFYANLPWGRADDTSYLVRTEPGQTAAVGAVLEKLLLDSNAGRTLRIRPLTAIKEDHFKATHAVVVMVTAVIFLLVFVTCLGILGVTSFSVAERTKQIGTRRALGARRLDIVRYFLVENGLMTVLGGVLGIGLAYALNWGLVTWVTGPKLELAYVLGGLFILALTGFVATLAPALRGSTLSPAIATRSV